MAETEQVEQAPKPWQCRQCDEQNAGDSTECSACKASKTVDGVDPLHPLEDSTGEYENLDGIPESDHEQVEKVIKQIKKLRSDCKTTSTPYMDRSFEGRSSIQSQFAEDKNNVQSKVYYWLRPTQMNRELEQENYPWTLFNNPQVNDVVQQTLGDCWLVSAMQLLTLRPNLLKRNFITKRYNKEGIYGVRLFRGGKWINSIIDDRIACDVDDKPTFGWSSRKQLWVGLLEKAAAKISRSYLDLTQGSASEAFRLLTGYGSLYTDIVEDQVLEKYDFLLETMERGIIHTGEIHFIRDVQHYLDIGLQLCHVYGVLYLKHLKEGTRILLLKNPLGTSRFNGDWNPTSNTWDAVESDDMPPQGKQVEKGQFWISLEEFGKYYQALTSTHIRETWSRTCNIISMACGDEESLYQSVELEVDEQMIVDVYPQQLSPTNHGTGDHFGMIAIIREDQVMVACTDADYMHQLFVTINLNPGKYRIYCWTFNTWIYRAGLENSIVTYSSKPLRATLSEEPKIQFGYQVLKLIIANGTQTLYEDGDHQLVIYRISPPNWAGVMIAAVNKHATNTCEVSIKCRNLRHFQGARRSITVQDFILPNHGQILNIITMKAGKSKSLHDGLEVETLVGNSVADEPASNSPPIARYNRALIRAFPLNELM